MEIHNTSNDSNNNINVLVYGESGVGKTTFAGSAAKKFKTVILSAEGGLLSLKKNMPEGVDYIVIKSFDDFIEAHNWLSMHKDANKYDTIVIDSLTEIQQACMDYLLKERAKDSGMGDYVQPQIKDWGALNSVMTKAIKYFRDIPKNLIITALSERSTNEETLETKIQPMLQGKLKENVAAYFDEVFYLHTRERKTKEGSKETVHVISTENCGKWLAKDRSGNLKPLVKPDFLEIYNTIFNNNNKEDK